MKIGYLGPKGTFTEILAKKIFPKEKLIPIKPIRNLVFAVDKKEIDVAIAPLENFYNGEVRETIDSLNECKYANIVSEKSLKIVHCLGALNGNKKITRIYSKDQAIEQCSSFISKNFPHVETIAVSSTAEAANKIKNENLIDSAVIASEESIKENGLNLLEKDLVPNNKTRFAIISNKKTKITGDDKTLVSIHPSKDKAGILYNTLGFFSNFDINLEDIKSRPDKKSKYYFYVELDGHREDKKVKMALNSIKYYLDPENKYPDTIKILGSYKNSHWKSQNDEN